MGGLNPIQTPKQSNPCYGKLPKRHPLILGNPISDQDFGMDLRIINMLCEEKVERIRAVL